MTIQNKHRYMKTMRRTATTNSNKSENEILIVLNVLVVFRKLTLVVYLITSNIKVARTYYGVCH